MGDFAYNQNAMSTTEVARDSARPPARPRAGRLARLAPWLLIGGLVLFFAVTNWLWLTENVTSTGWDKPRHLARSLYYAQILSQPSIRSLFTVVISDPVRTPLFPASAAIMYWLFGRTADVATMVNILYLAAGLAATYGIGRRWARSSGQSRTLGLVAVALLATFPMYYAMSRYFYLEFALTATVAINVFLLLATDGFKRRDMSVLFGISLGLTLLTKRTAALFLVGPIVAVVLTSGLLPMLWKRLKQRPRLPLRTLGLAIVYGLVPAGLWYWPNRDIVHGLYLGDALFFIWWALAGLAAYFLLLPPAPLSNALAAAFLGAGLASTWYLARITEFLQRVAIYGYGVDDPRGRTLNLGDIDTYLYYLRKLGNEHLSILVLIVLVAVLAVAASLYVRRHGSMGRALRHLRPEAWAVMAWVAGGYLFLTLSIYQETRAFTPVLPAVALIFGAALLRLPGRWLRRGLLAVLLLFGLLQFFVVSFEPFYRQLTPHYSTVPLWGRTSLLAQGVYIQLPDEAKTDHRYAIQPDVLKRMEERRTALGREALRLGLLVNTSQINAGPFNYLILNEYPQLQVESFIERFNAESPYRELFGQDYLAIKRVNAGMNEVQKALIGQLLDAPPQLFSQAFELETSYALPDGDTVTLYRQRAPLPADYPAEYITGLAEQLSARNRPGDVILITPPELLATFVAHYDGPADVVLAPEDSTAWAEWVEAAVLPGHYDRVFLVLGDPAAGHGSDVARLWLGEQGFWAANEWSGSIQLLVYGLAGYDLGRPATAPTAKSGAVWAGQLELTGYDLPARSWQPGDVLPLTLFWHRRTTPQADYAVFIHLYAPDGRLLAQSDSAPAAGARPTSGWLAGETIVDRHGLLLPDNLPDGEYTLVMGTYLPPSGDRLAVTAEPLAPSADRLSLGTVRVGIEPAPASDASGPEVAFVGDSLTRGNRSTDNIGFAGLAAGSLDWQDKRYIWFHIPQAVELLSEVGQPDVIVLELGIHATKGCDEAVTADPAEFRRYYGLLLDKAQELAPQVVAINIPWLQWGEKRLDKATAFNAIIAEEAAARGISVVDAWTVTRACGLACISDDDFHPNDEGHQRIADELIRIFREN